MYNIFKKLFTQRANLEVDLHDQSLEGLVHSFERERPWAIQGIYLRKVVTPNTAWFKHDASGNSPEIMSRVHYKKSEKRIEVKTTQKASFYLHYRLLAIVLISGVSSFLLQDKIDLGILMVFAGLPIVWFLIYTAGLYAEIKSFNSELIRELTIRINHSRGML